MLYIDMTTVAQRAAGSGDFCVPNGSVSVDSG